MRATAILSLGLILCGCSQSSVILKQDFRSEVLKQLERNGSNLTKGCRLDFYVFLPTESLARTLGERLIKECTVDIIADIRPSSSGSDYLCQVTTLLDPRTAPLNELLSKIDQLVHEFHADFDGWEVTQ